MKKGDKVWWVQNWDDKGAVRAVLCIVDSAGKKRIHLREASGEMTERRFYAEDINQFTAQPHIIPDNGVDDVRAYGLKLAADHLVVTRARMTKAVEAYAHLTDYCRGMQRELAALHAPEVVIKM